MKVQLDEDELRDWQEHPYTAKLVERITNDVNDIRDFWKNGGFLNKSVEENEATAGMLEAWEMVLEAIADGAFIENEEDEEDQDGSEDYGA